MQREGGRDAPDRSPACASCKHQRKRCKKDCVLAPFFPAEKEASFKEVHRLFGVSNVQKHIERIKRERGATEAEVNESVEAIKWVASLFEREPIHGCHGEFRRMLEENTKLREAISYYQYQLPQLPLGGGWGNVGGHPAYHQFRQHPRVVLNGHGGYINSGNGGLNPQQMQIQPHPYLGPLEGLPGASAPPPPPPPPPPYVKTLDKQLPPLHHGFRTAAARPQLGNGGFSPPYYDHLPEHAGNNGAMGSKEEGSWGGAGVP